MHPYIQMLLCPDVSNLVPVPDEYPRPVSVFKQTGNFTVLSSAALGHALVKIQPQNFSYTGNGFITWYQDGGANLNVNAYNTGVTSNYINGTDLSGYYSYLRLVAFQVRLVYIGAVLTGSGEGSIGLDNVNNVTSTWNIRNNIQEAPFRVKGRAEDTFECVWIPQDEADFKFRSAGDPYEADRSAVWGSITFASTGLPLNASVYDVEWTAVLEGLTAPGAADYIPRVLSPPGDRARVLQQLNTMLLQEPGIIARVNASKSAVRSNVQTVYANTVSTTLPTGENTVGYESIPALPTGTMTGSVTSGPSSVAVNPFMVGRGLAAGLAGAPGVRIYDQIQGIYNRIF